MDESRKRKADVVDSGPSNKKGKHKKQWRTPRQSQADEASRIQNIVSGDSGIWVTCTRGKEAKCIDEISDLFEEYVNRLYNRGGQDPSISTTHGGSIEDEIKKELEDIQQPTALPLFFPVRVELECVVFFKTRSPIEPVSFVHEICKDAAADSWSKRTRFVKRLSPVSLIGRATDSDLNNLSKEVLAPHFHHDNETRKFAIRPNIRNSNQLSRDAVITQIASAVGPQHTVDLKAYDLLIIVEIYKNVCGMSVVGSDYDKLKRYNLAEIYNPTQHLTDSAENGKESTDKGIR